MLSLRLREVRSWSSGRRLDCQKSLPSNAITLLLPPRYLGNDLIGQCTISLFDLMPPDGQNKLQDLEFVRRLHDPEGNPVINEGENDGNEVIVPFRLFLLQVHSFPWLKQACSRLTLAHSAGQDACDLDDHQVAHAGRGRRVEAPLLVRGDDDKLMSTCTQACMHPCFHPLCMLSLSLTEYRLPRTDADGEREPAVAESRDSHTQQGHGRIFARITSRETQGWFASGRDCPGAVLEEARCEERHAR